MRATITPLEGTNCPAFPKYRRNFPTLYNLTGVLTRDAIKRGVNICWDFGGTMRQDGGTAYIVTEETNEPLGVITVQ